MLVSKVLTPEEDEEQLIMRRMRNSVDELRRGYRFLISTFTLPSDNISSRAFHHRVGRQVPFLH